MRLNVTVAAGTTMALPRIVSLLHRRAVSVTYLEYRRHGDGHVVELDVETTSRSEHLVHALARLVEVLDVREAPAEQHQEWITTPRQVLDITPR